MNKNIYFVYGLIDPINKIPFYIGKGKGNRPLKHLNGQDTINKDKVNYIKNIRMLGEEPYITYVMKNLEEQEAYDYEEWCINECLVYNPHLTNKILNGNKPPSRKGCKTSEETKAKISAANKGKPCKYKTHIPKEDLFELYFKQNRTIKYISAKYNVSTTIINIRLRQFGFRKRAEN